MFIVLELQKNSDGTVGNIVYTFDTLNEADSKFHNILSYAAVSDVPIHSAVILSERGKLIKTDSYEHKEDV